MKESHRKGLANRPGSESCGVAREGGAEALTGAHAGQVLSCEISSSRVPTPLNNAEGHKPHVRHTRLWKVGQTSPAGRVHSPSAVSNRRPDVCRRRPEYWTPGSTS